MEESWSSKISRWKGNPEQFRSEWWGEVKWFVKSNPRTLYALFLVVAGYTILQWVD